MLAAGNHATGDNRMTITTRLRAVLCCALLATLPPAAFAQADNEAASGRSPAVAQAVDVFARDPQAGIAALEALRADPGHPAFAEAGLPLMQAYINQGRNEDANALAETLLADPGLAPDAELALLADWMTGLFGAGDLSRLDLLEPRAQRLAADTALPATRRAAMLHQLMALYTRVPRFDRALQLIGQIEDLLQGQPSVELATAASAKGAILAMQGHNAGAIEALREAERVNIALGRGDDPQLMRNMAGLFINLGEHQRAIDYASRGELAQRSLEPAPTPASRRGMLSVLATAYIAAGDFENGQRWSREAIDYGRQHGLSVTGDQSNYATLLRDNGRHAEALAIYRQLRAQVAPTDLPEMRGVLDKNIGESLVALGRRGEAAGYLQSAREVYATADVRPRRLELYPVLIENLEALGRTAEALTAMHEFKALSDETITAESKTRIGELEAAIDLERKSKALAEAEAANARERAANETLQAEKSRARAINLALAASLVALAALLALLWRSARVRARAHRAVARQSREDELTGLGNRRGLVEAMAEPRAGSSLLVMADLDHFKRINDEYGHDTGDRALRLFADALRTVARHDDVLVRWGGEEFVWLCRGADAAQGPLLCERLLRQVRDTALVVDGRRVPITASLGFAPLPTWPGGTSDWETALRIADHAVYCSKDAGRDRWTGFVGVAGSAPTAGATPAALEQAGALARLAPPP